MNKILDMVSEIRNDDNSLRLGQTIMNVLFDEDRKLYDDLKEKGFDIFYKRDSDETVLKVIEIIKEKYK